MTIQQLNYAIAVFRAGSINRAAQKLYIAQPNLSNAIKSLEDELNITLFQRTPRGMEPTRAGEKFILRAMELVAQFDAFETLYASRQADVLSLHCPLTDETRHMIDADAIASMKPGAVLINTSRGALVDTEALIEGLRSRKVGAACLDVYEEEADLFYEDRSESIIEDDTLVRLISMPNVIVTSHQAFLTKEALNNIAAATVENLLKFERGEPSPETEVCYRGAQ